MTKVSPSKHSDVMLTIGGIETTLLFKSSFPLRNMAAFETLLSDFGTDHLDSILAGFADVAVRYNRGLVIDTQTWRASSRWFDELDTSPEDRERIYKLAVKHAEDLASTIHDATDGAVTPIVQGIVGPMSDGYVDDGKVTVDEARRYHAPQVRAMKDANTKLITAATITSAVQAEAIALEAAEVGIPCVISFTLGLEGKLPSGETLGNAITHIDKSVDPKPVFYSVNCVHPRHIKPVLKDAVDKEEKWVQRLKAFQGNASAKSHEELDESKELDEGDPAEWAKEVVELREISPDLTVLGGCCGTSAAHCEEIAKLLDK